MVHIYKSDQLPGQTQTLPRPGANRAYRIGIANTADEAEVNTVDCAKQVKQGFREVNLLPSVAQAVALNSLTFILPAVAPKVAPCDRSITESSGPSLKAYQQAAIRYLLNTTFTSSFRNNQFKATIPKIVYNLTQLQLVSTRSDYENGISDSASDSAGGKL